MSFLGDQRHALRNVLQAVVVMNPEMLCFDGPPSKGRIKHHRPPGSAIPAGENSAEHKHYYLYQPQAHGIIRIASIPETITHIPGTAIHLYHSSEPPFKHYLHSRHAGKQLFIFLFRSIKIFLFTKFKTPC
jgi:hypothetical protein